MSGFAGLVEGLADVLQPVFGASAAAAAIVLFTASVRVLLLPLSLAAARGQKARAVLRPKIAELRRKHGRDPERLQRAVLELHAREKVSPLSGCLPSLCQLPTFFLLYHLFSSASVGGRANDLLGHELFSAPLGGRWVDAVAGGEVLGGAGLVYAGLFAVVAVVAFLGYRLSKRMMTAAQAEPMAGMEAVGRVLPFMSFFTLITVAVVPLAAALYVVTSTAWSLVERAVLYR